MLNVMLYYVTLCVRMLYYVILCYVVILLYGLRKVIFSGVAPPPGAGTYYVILRYIVI